MIAFRTRPLDLVERLDAEFYQPEFVAAHERLTSHLKTVSFDALWHDYNRIYIGIAGFESVPRTDDYTHYIRPVDISDDGEIDYNHLPWCFRHWLSDYGARGCARPGDLIVEVKGNTKRVAVVNHRIPENCLVSGSAYRIALKNSVDPWFIQAFLLCDLGQVLKRRLTSNTTISYIDPESFRNLPIPDVESRVQRAIGNKLKKAERLHEFCTSFWERATRTFEQSSGLSLQLLSYQSVDPQAVTTSEYICISGEPAVVWVRGPEVLAAQYYHPRRVHSQQIVASRGNWDPLSKLMVPKSTRAPGFIPARCIGLDQIDSKLGVIASDGVGSEQEQPSGISYSSGDILFSRLRPYLNKVAVWPRDWADGTGSGELLVYEPSRLVDSHYVFFVLKSPLGLYQVLDVTTGSTLPRVDSQVVEEVRIPRLSSEQEAAIGDLVRSAHRFWYESQQLLPAAKNDVEALIDGSLDQARIIAQGNETDHWLQDNPSPYPKRSK